MDCPIQHIPSRIGLPSVHGRQVSAALGKVHNWQAAVPRMNISTLHYEAYEALQVRTAMLERRLYGGSCPLRGTARCRDAIRAPSAWWNIRQPATI